MLLCSLTCASLRKNARAAQELLCNELLRDVNTHLCKRTGARLDAYGGPYSKI